MVDLITESPPQRHAFLTAVRLERLSNSGLDLLRPRLPSQEEPFLDYVHQSWFIHPQHSRDDPLTRGRLAEFVQRRHPFPFGLERIYFHDPGYYALLSPLHLLAYFNLPIALAGSEQLRNPNVATPLIPSATSPAIRIGMTALYLACAQGSDVAVKELLDLPSILVNEAGVRGTAPLTWAIRGQHEGAISLLLACPDIDANAVNIYGMSALYWASRRGHVSTVKLLLPHPDINPSVADRYGNTPLHRASRRKDVVGLLLARPDVDGRRSLVEETREARGRILSLLEETVFQLWSRC